MTPTRLRACLGTIGWSQRELARRIRYDERQVRRWASGAKIPTEVAAWIEAVAALLSNAPTPRRAEEESPAA